MSNQLAESLNKKREVRNVDWDDIIDLKTKGIADLCYTTVERVEEVRKKVLKENPNPQPDNTLL